MKSILLVVLVMVVLVSCDSHSLRPTDTTRPARIEDLSLDSIRAGNLYFSWTATGDDGDDGTATNYDLRSAADSSTLLSWGGAIQMQGEPVPSASGSHETTEIPNNFNPPRYFALKVSDESNNTSAISNIVSLSQQKKRGRQLMLPASYPELQSRD